MRASPVADLPHIGAGPGELGLVSVVIPAYNRGYILGEAIASVLSQLHEHVEILVADDGSTDDTRRVLEGYDGRVRHLFQENAGVSAARNLGLRHARGEFVALLDSDDRWLDWKLTAQLSLFQKFPDVGMVWTDMAAVDDAGHVWNEAYLRTFYSAYRKVRIEDVCETSGSVAELWPEAPPTLTARPYYKGDIFPYMILGNLVHTSTVMLRRDRLREVGGFDESLLKSGEDYEFHLRTCSKGPVAFLDASSTLYRVGNADQLTAPHLKMHIARNNLETVTRWMAIKREGVSLPAPVIRKRLAESFGWLGEQEFQTGDSWGAFAHLWKSLRLNPNQPRTALLLVFSILPPVCFRAAKATRRGLQRMLGRATRVSHGGGGPGGEEGQSF